MNLSDFVIRNQPPLQFKPSEWLSHKKDQYCFTKARATEAEKLIAHNDRTQSEVQELIKKNKNETEWLFKGRIKDVDFLRIELEKKRKSVYDELEILEILQERIQDELKCISRNASEIIQKCIDFRLI